MLKSESGMSLVEIMVGLVVALLGTLVIYQVFAVSEGQKRTTTGGSDAQQGGAYALHQLERMVLMAGNGIANISVANKDGQPVPASALACRVAAHGPTGPLPLFTMIPALITDGVGGASDTIQLIYGNSRSQSNAVVLNAAANNGATSVNVASVLGFSVPAGQPGDFVLIAPSRNDPPTDCTLVQLTAMPPPILPATVAAGPGLLTFDPALSLRNRPGGIAVGAPGYSDDAAAINLARVPVMAVINVSAGFELQSASLLDPAVAPAPIVDGVVNLQAQYGLDTNNDAVVDSWVEPVAPWHAAGITTEARVSQIRAMRLGIVMRSSLPERPDPDGVCRTTPNLLVALPARGGPAPMPASPAMAAPSADWACFRYKTFEAIVPLRNMVWSDWRP